MSDDVEDDDSDAASVVGTSSTTVLSVDDSEQRERTVLSHSAPSSVDALPPLIARCRATSPFLASRRRCTVATSVSSIILARLDTSDAVSLKNVPSLSSSSSLDVGRRSSADRQSSLAS